jgi:hypothetical protein
MSEIKSGGGAAKQTTEKVKSIKIKIFFIGVKIKWLKIKAQILVFECNFKRTENGNAKML